MVSCLKRARLLFDEVYPDGPTMGVLMLEKPRAKKKDRHKSPVDSQQSTMMTTDSSLEGPALMNRRLTNLRMAPVLGHSNTNYSHSTSGEQQHDEYESEEERFGEDMLVDNDCEELDNIHRLYGYLPDEGYNPTSMEEDGNYPEELTWTYEDLPAEGLHEDLYHYSGPGPCLRPYVSTRFRTVLEAFGVAGGFTYELIKRITANSNAYASKNLKGSNFAGSFWHPISVEEMYHFLGIILKMSIDNRQVGGYHAYFSPPMELFSTPGDSTKIHGFSSWAADVMSEYRFRQIRAAFHPENGVSVVGDKCHQLRSSIKSLNEYAKRTFILGRECSFDEGGIASKSRYNPVRQYNSSKPDKYQIDFFVLVNTSRGINFIYHIDVYQGKNATNPHIAKEAWSLPTTQKAVINAVVSSGISTDPDGM